MKHLGKLTVSGLLAVVMATMPFAASAANVSVNSPTDSFQQTVVLEKTGVVVPSFTVEIPATVELGAEAQDLTFTLTLENDEAFIPSGKKVSVTIDSAGYPTALDRFAVWDSKNLKEATYEVYYSDRMAGGRYAIGDEIASWTTGNWGTQTRRINVLNYDSVEPGSYSGVINYGISLVDVE